MRALVLPDLKACAASVLVLHLFSIVQTANAGESVAPYTWTEATASAPWSGRDGLASVVLPNDGVLVLGGYSQPVSGGVWLNDVWRSTDKGVSWTQLTASAPWQGRYGLGAVVVPSSGAVVVLGGYGRTGTTDYTLSDVWASTDSGAAWTQQTSAAAWASRAYFSVVALSSGNVLVIGGRGSHSGPAFNDVWRSTNGGATWTQVTSAASWAQRYRHRCAVLSDDSVLLVGGTGVSFNQEYNDVWRSTNEGASWTQLTASAPWEKRWLHSVISLPGDGGVLLSGGFGSSNYRNDVWRSRDGGTSWEQVPHEGGQSALWRARYDHGSVALPSDGSVLILGGYVGGSGESFRNDVWRATAVCAAGSFGAAVSAAQAVSCALCPVDTFTSTDNADTACTPCGTGAGKFTDGVSGATSCTTCAGGNAFDESTSPRTCEPCPVDTTSAVGDAVCSACGPGSYTAGATGAETCSACAAGHVYNGMVSPRTCEPCPVDTSSGGAGDDSCHPCDAGTYTGGATGSTCRTCDAGLVLDRDASPKVCEPCPIDTTSSAGDAACSVCEGGTLTHGATGATTCTTCAAGTILRGDVTDPEPRTCVPCPANTYSDAGDATCSPCPPATDTAGTTGAASCIPRPCLCLNPLNGITVGIVALLLAAGAVVWAGLLPVWSLCFDMLVSVGDFGSDVLYVTTEPFWSPALLVAAVIFVLAPTLSIVVVYVGEAGRPGCHFTARLPENVDNLPKVFAVLIYYVLHVAWWLVLVLAGLLLAVSKAACAVPVKLAWIRMWKGDSVDVAHTVAPKRTSAERFSIKDYNRVFFAELVTETLPQLVVQVLNNTARGTWSDLAVVSLGFSAFFVLNNLFRYAYWMCWKRVPLGEVPQNGIQRRLGTSPGLGPGGAKPVPTVPVP